MKLNAQQLRENAKNDENVEFKQVERNNIYLLVENVYDTYNIGGLFRLADALAVKKLYLIGDTETPPNGRILKASIGTYKVVPWVYKKTTQEAIDELRNVYKTGENALAENRGETKTSGIRILAVEQAENSVDYREADYTEPVALLVGNETYGVTEDTLKLVDQIVEIPMWGINKSLNVIVSAAIVSYFAIGKITSRG